METNHDTNSIQQSSTPIARTVKTLLMCKVRPSALHNNDKLDYPTIYQDIHTGKNGQRYFTLGNADAVSIYETCEPLSSNWFSRLYEDKQEIILAANSKLNYHPIHLVANRNYDNTHSGKPICVITLLYGVRPWKTEPGPDEEPSLSRYELKIQRFLKALSGDNPPYEYEVYNAVNICDAVILWYTDNLWEVLAKTEQLTSKQFARKTFTLIGFSMDENGVISVEAQNALLNSPEPSSPVHVRILGSIRDQSKYRTDLNTICQKLMIKPKDMQDYFICGQTDFSVLIPNMSNKMFLTLLDHYMVITVGRQYAETYWEIHTELMYDDPDKKQIQLKQTTEADKKAPTAINCGAPSKDCGTTKQDNLNLPEVSKIIGPECILDKLYAGCRAFAEKHAEELRKEFPWFGAFVELFNVHSNIDRDPILYGPGFLLYYSMKVFLWYLEQWRKEKGEKKKASYLQMLLHSRNNIQKFLQALSGLTDQMMRIDDLVFHGFGNNSALYNTLPECALDFYHSFLLKFIDLIVAVDAIEKRLYTDKNIENKEYLEDYFYDFLLLPELECGISIDPVFATDTLKRPKLKDKDKRALWPAKQAFLVHFPIETVYSPVRFFAPLVHECFHLLGDACRLRRDRVDYVCAFFASLFATHFVCGSQEDEDKNIAAFFFCQLRQAFPVDNLEPNFPEMEAYLQQGIKKLFTAEGLKTIRSKQPEEYIFYTSEFVRIWADSASALGSQENYWRLGQLNPDWDAPIKECTYLFKECYADLMMVLTLGLSSETYLKLFEEDLIRAEKELKYAFLTRDAQRIALVLHACTDYKFPDSENQKSKVADTWAGKMIIDNLNQTSIQAKVKGIILACYTVLQDENKALPTDINDDIRLRLFPRASVQYVADYLEQVRETFGVCFVNGKHSKDLDTLRTEFKSFFIDGNFISNEYFQIIRTCHKDIRDNREASLNPSSSL